MQSINVAYILLHFPHLTETFVAEEIQAIRSQGINVRIISLLKPKPGPVQPLSQQLLPCTWYAPDLLTLSLWRAHCHFLLKSPRLYLGLLAHLLRQPYTRTSLTMLAKRLVTFLKAVAVSHYLEGSDTQLLHAHFARLPGAAAWIIARLLDLPFTVTVHAFEIYSYKNDLLRLVTSQASRVITISEHNRRQIAALTARPAEAISVIHCGVNLAKLWEQSRREAKRPAGDLLRILSVGSLVPKKGHSYLVAACDLLKKRGFDFACTIIGGGPSEPILQQQIQVRGLQNHVNLLGARPHPQIMAAYHQHDLFVLASVVAPGGDRDGIPVVLMEAGALGLPIISTRVSGIPELVRHNETGWLVPPSDAEALADAITALGTDPVLQGHLGQNARALVQAEFSIERNALLMAALLQNTYQQWKRNRDADSLQPRFEDGFESVE
jgi:colanic acid/amylovoran biosynthesis glycosyltransferase